MNAATLLVVDLSGDNSKASLFRCSAIERRCDGADDAINVSDDAEEGVIPV